jgi:hypothetical protein
VSLAKDLRECRFESFRCSVTMLDAVEEAAVVVEREARVGMPELTADVDDAQPLGDQQRRVGVPEVVEAKRRLQIVIEVGPGDRDREASAGDVSVVRFSGCRGEDGIGCCGPEGGVLVFGQEEASDGFKTTVLAERGVFGSL